MSSHSVCFRTFVFVLHRVVGTVDPLLQLIPGQQIFSCLVLHIKQMLKVPEHNNDDLTIS